MYSSAVFTVSRPICTQILPGQGRPPSTILGIRKLKTLVRTASSAFPRFDTIPECDGQTDERTDGYSAGYCACKTNLRRAVKTNQPTINQSVSLIQADIRNLNTIDVYTVNESVTQQNKQVRQLSGLAYIPTCRSP